jgi:uncharacterized membrane protein
MPQQTTSLSLPAAMNGHTFHVEHEKMWLWLIIMVGAMLRLYRLDFQSLWADEGLQYFVASAESLGEVLGRRSRTFHPLLSLLINHGFLWLGKSEFFLRLPSALFGIGSLPLCYVLAKRVTCRLTALFTVLVLAIAPFHIWYSQEGRMYAQLLFLSLLSTVLLLRALERRKLHWWAFYTLAVTAGMYTHVCMALGIMAQLLWVLLCQRQRLLAFATSSAAAVLLCLPLAPWWTGFFFHRVGIASVSTDVILEERLGFMALPYTLFAYGAGYSLGPSVVELHDNRSLGFLLGFLPSILAVGIVFGTLLVIGIVVSHKRFGVTSLLLCLLGLGVPFAGVAVISLLTRFPANARYPMVAFPYFCILIGTALASLWRKNTLAGALAVFALLGISAASLSNHFFNPYYAKEDVRSAVAFWRAASAHEPLFSAYSAAGVKYAINRYLEESERELHFPLGVGRKHIVENINAFFSTHDASSIYIVLVRDWHQKREKAIRNAFAINHEHSYPGVKIFRVFRP